MPKSLAIWDIGACLRSATATTSRRNSSGNALGMVSILPVRCESLQIRSQPRLGQSRHPKTGVGCACVDTCREDGARWAEQTPLDGTRPSGLQPVGWVRMFLSGLGSHVSKPTVQNYP